MTKEEFNSLPLEARSFIENHSGCLSCGNVNSKLTKAYELYLKNRQMTAYQIRGGGINYHLEKTNESGVLYSISQNDEPLAIREKIRIAKLLHSVNPRVFISYNENVISEILSSLPDGEVVTVKEETTEVEYTQEEINEIETFEEVEEVEAPVVETKNKFQRPIK